MDGDPQCVPRRSSCSRRGSLCVTVLFTLLGFLVTSSQANPDAKRLYDDLLSNYNRLIRPVSNNTDTVLVKLGLRLSQLIDLVSTQSISYYNFRILINIFKIQVHNFAIA
jgi:hypothetical protein